MKRDKDIIEFKREVRRCLLIRGFTFKEEKKKSKLRKFAKFASFADNPRRTIAEHKAIVETKCNHTLFSAKEDATTPIEDISANALVHVLQLMKFAQPRSTLFEDFANVS